MTFDQSLTAFDESQRLDVPIVHPDYDSLDAIFNKPKENRAEVLACATEAWHEILLWLLNPEGKTKPQFTRGNSVAIRLYAMAWSVCPDYFEGKSIERVAAHLGVSKQIFSFYVTEYSKTFQHNARGMKSPFARCKSRVAQLRAARQRRAREHRQIWR